MKILISEQQLLELFSSDYVYPVKIISQEDFNSQFSKQIIKHIIYSFLTKDNVHYDVMVEIYTKDRRGTIDFRTYSIDNPEHDSMIQLINTHDSIKVFNTLKSIIDKHKKDIDKLIISSTESRMPFYRKILAHLNIRYKDIQPNALVAYLNPTNDDMKLNEGDDKYLNFLLDKVSKIGLDSLDPLEKDDLKRLSNDEDFDKASSILRFTAAKDKTIIPRNRKYTMTGSAKYGTFKCFICGDAEKLAGNEIPIFFEGNLSTLDKPIDEQKIKMYIPSGEYDCVAVLDEDERIGTFYCLFLRDEYMRF